MSIRNDEFLKEFGKNLQLLSYVLSLKDLLFVVHDNNMRRFVFTGDEIVRVAQMVHHGDSPRHHQDIRQCGKEHKCCKYAGSQPVKEVDLFHCVVF
jgi:hypothetical protein